MKHWKLKVYIKDRGTDVIREWLQDQSLSAQEEIDTRFRYMETLKNWVRPYSAKRRGTNDIHEIIITHKQIQYRPLGFFGPEPGEFTLLVGAIEKDWKLIPKGADAIADGRRKLIMANKGKINDYFKEP